MFPWKLFLQLLWSVSLSRKAFRVPLVRECLCQENEEVCVSPFAEFLVIQDFFFQFLLWKKAKVLGVLAVALSLVLVRGQNFGTETAVIGGQPAPRLLAVERWVF